jgi:hypothetical protein
VFATQKPEPEDDGDAPAKQKRVPEQGKRYGWYRRWESVDKLREYANRRFPQDDITHRNECSDQ